MVDLHYVTYHLDSLLYTLVLVRIWWWARKSGITK
jgi:hypothetical protein